MWNEHERDGKINQVKGQAKQAIAAVTGDENLKAEGQVDEAAGRIESAVGETRRTIGKAITRVGDAVKNGG